MPPDMTAGLMPLVGTPPGIIAPGKPATGPPGTSTPSTIAPGVDTLFASLLAQSAAPASPSAIPKQSVSKEAGPNNAIPKDAAQKEIAALPVSPGQNTLPALLTPILPNPKQLTSENLKPMDTLPLSLLPTEKAKEKASELPLHKASADAPGASSQIPAPSSVSVPAIAVPVIAVPVPRMLSVPVLSAAVSTAVPLPIAVSPASTALVSVLGQSAPLPGSVIDTPPAVSLPLPRTFAVTAPASVLPPASPAGSPPLGQRAVSTEKPTVPSAVKTAAVLPHAASLLSTAALSAAAPAAAMPASEEAPAAPVITGLNMAARSQAVPSGQVLSALPPVPAPAMLPALAGPNLSPPASVPGKVDGKSTENPLKSPVGNADNNTRTLTAPPPVPPAQTASEKHSEAQADPVPLDNLLAGTQPLAAAAGAAAATESKPVSAADRAEMVRQVANGVGAMPLPAKPGEAQQMSLQFHPKDWGSLQVSVSVVPGAEANSAKTVTAHLVAETPQVKAALESQTGALREALRSSGLHLEHLTVSVKPPEMKLTEIKPASEAASAGMSSSGQPGTNMGSSQTQGGQSSGFASFAGSSHNGRQGQPQSAFTAALAEPEPEDMPRTALPLSSARGRIDTRA